MLHTTQTEPTAIARRHAPAGPLAVATPTTRKLADASISVNTRRAYLGALTRVDAWRGDDPLTDGVLGGYRRTAADLRGRGQAAPAERGRARRHSRHRRTSPHRRPGHRIPHHGATPGPHVTCPPQTGPVLMLELDLE